VHTVARSAVHCCTRYVSVPDAAAATSSSLSALPPRTPPRPTLFPYTTLFRSLQVDVDAGVPNDSFSLESEYDCRLTLRKPAPLRSEEHTSELQSQSNLVCRLLLEKKKKDGNT